MSPSPLAIRLLLLAIATAAASATTAEIFSPGIVHGYVHQTRWGNHVFFSGPYQKLMTAQAADQLAGLGGVPLRIDVEEVELSAFSGGGRIQRIGSFERTAAMPGLEIGLALPARDVAVEHGVPLHLWLRNTSDRPIRIPAAAVSIVVVAPLPFAHDAMRRGNWPYRAGTSSIRGEVLEVEGFAARQLYLPWRDGGFADPMDVPVVPPTDWHVSAARGDALTVGPGALLEASAVVGHDLPTGAYEVFAHVQIGNFSEPPGPVSARLALDVVDPASLLTAPEGVAPPS